MRTLRQRKYLFALLAILALFAACKGESPTAPPLNTGGGGGGGTTPPAGSSVVITASNLNPVTGSITNITVAVTQNNNPVANGTAVELSTTRGNFVDLASNASLGSATLLTTSNGQVRVGLTSSSAGTATVRAVVNNIAEELVITFGVGSGDPGGSSGAPTITGISPAFGPPAGGTLVTITGTNFRAPVRVLFDFGSPVGTKEAFVVSQTNTQIQVLTPAVDLAGGQALPATIKVIVGAGNTGEQTVTAGTPFNFQLQVLTPSITTISPASGPIDGGTRVTIFGSGFQAPVQVFFGSAEAQVLNVVFDQIIAVTPTGRDTNPDGSGPLTGPISVRVVNINSNTQATLAGAFRYTPKMQITAAGPTQGPFTGGTKVTIDGTGFNDPIAVSIGGVAAQPIKVTGTQIIAVTLPLALTSCGGQSGPISVTNIDNGDTATAEGLTFLYLTPKPTITFITGDPANGGGPGFAPAGTTVRITVDQALPGTNKFTIGGKTVFATSASPTPNGIVPVEFIVTLPTDTAFTFPTQPCNVAGVTGTQKVGLTVDVTYTNVNTGCTDTAAGGLTILPTDTSCVVPPPPTARVVSPVAPACADAGDIVAAGTVTGTTSITIQNVGGQPLVLGAAITSATNGTITIAPINATVAPAASQVFTVTIDPTAAGPVTGTATFATNDPANATINVCIRANGTVATPPAATVLTPPPPACANAGDIIATGTVTGTTSITIQNTGGQPLVLGASITVATNAGITIAPTSATVAPGATQTFTVTVDPTAPGAVTGTATFGSNDPARPSFTVCIQANGT